MTDKKKKNKLSKFGAVLLLAVLSVGALFLLEVACNCEKSLPDSEKISPLDVDYNAGKEFLESLAWAAKIYSTKNGGRGESKFPSTVSLIVDFIPPVLANALENLEDDTNNPIPVGGYLGRMVKIEDSNDFLFEVYPAPGFVGNTLVISKDMIVREKVNIQTTETNQ